MTDDLTTESGWLTARERALTPRTVSELRTTQTDRDEFLRGATLLRFHGETARPGQGVQPQQLVVVDMLAAGNARNVVLLPRRSSKTTTLIEVALGRAEARRDYRVGILTLTSGKAGRSRFVRDVVPALERIAGTPDVKAWPFKITRANGQERVEFKESGGSVSWLSSIDDLRGEAFDLVLLDEGQAADPAKAAEVVAAALPTTDTRPGAQLVVAGTATSWTKGNLLHDWLELARGGRGGIVEYAADPNTADDVLETWETVAPLVLTSHPGVGTLTTPEAVEANYEAMTVAAFACEYLGIWGNGGGTRAVFDPAAWLAAGEDGTPVVPDRFALAVCTSFTGDAASIVASWRDEDGKGCGYVLDRRRGTTWAAEVVARLARDHGAAILYDKASSAMRVEVEALQRMSPRPRIEEQGWNDVQAGAALIVKEVNRGNARHWKQPALDDPAAEAVRRTAGANAWALGRPRTNPDLDLSAMEAWALGLHWYDENPQRAAFAPIVAA